MFVNERVGQRAEIFMVLRRIVVLFNEKAGKSMPLPRARSRIMPSSTGCSMNANVRTLLQGGGLKAQLLRGGAASSGLKIANVGHVLFDSGTLDIVPPTLQNCLSSAPREYARSSILSVCRKLGAFLFPDAAQ
jgi:hypothetical protein